VGAIHESNNINYLKNSKTTMDISGIFISFALGLVGALFSGIFVYLWQNWRESKDDVKKNASNCFCFYMIFYCILVASLVFLAITVPVSSNSSCANQTITYVVNYYNVSEINIEDKKTALSVEEVKYLIQKNPKLL
jgi:hypothetical protein